MRLDRDTLAPSNAALVRRVVGLCAEHGRPAGDRRRGARDAGLPAAAGMSPLLWRPRPEAAAATQIAALARKRGFDGRPRALAVVGRAPGRVLAGGLGPRRGQGEPEADRVLVDGDKMPGARWFEGARLNFAENLLRRDDATPALIFVGEDGSRRELSWAELQAEVRGARGGARGRRRRRRRPRRGLHAEHPRDRSSRCWRRWRSGAIWSSASPDFGVDGVLDRFGQIEPKVLFAVDGYRYAGKRIDIRRQGAGGRRGIPGLVRTVLVPFLEADAQAVADAVSYDDYRRSDARSRWSSRGCRLIIRSISSTPPARRGYPRRSCMVRAGRCCSISRNTGCTPTAGRASGCSTSRPAAG